MLNEKNITMICEAIEGKKGTKKWFDICKTNFNQKRAMKHMHTDQADWVASFNKIFKILNKLEKKFHENNLFLLREKKKLMINC